MLMGIVLLISFVCLFAMSVWSMQQVWACCSFVYHETYLCGVISLPVIWSLAQSISLAQSATREVFCKQSAVGNRTVRR